MENLKADEKYKELYSMEGVNHDLLNHPSFRKIFYQLIDIIGEKIPYQISCDSEKIFITRKRNLPNDTNGYYVGANINDHYSIGLESVNKEEYLCVRNTSRTQHNVPSTGERLLNVSSYLQVFDSNNMEIGRSSFTENRTYTNTDNSGPDWIIPELDVNNTIRGISREYAFPAEYKLEYTYNTSDNNRQWEHSVIGRDPQNPGIALKAIVGQRGRDIRREESVLGIDTERPETLNSTFPIETYDKLTHKKIYVRDKSMSLETAINEYSNYFGNKLYEGCIDINTQHK